MTEIQIEYDDNHYVVYYVSRGKRSEIAYGDKHTTMKDHAQNFYELAASLGASVSQEKI